ncbi:DUF1223 domain-containing protein [Celeribacter indicus]|uniref:Secreted protein n=1 Tax=Celeribacter indicus TaxID=1208324 RepID=A0A0B5DTF1_9RHOB|nr:DUF1223 domain-containing protein [Celeribacter indicus]AJE46349.1 hypothetical protein P73_1634 [Celeribacter indicus]SDW54156.1 hypothetical protein SAMN05443573_104185 [Celeribacter indicus]
MLTTWRGGLAGLILTTSAGIVPAGLAADAAAPARGHATGPVIVELFTSQGCSSCPPADAMIAELATRDDVLPLSLHVDYWDYIGWRDGFAQPQFTERQKAYAHAAGKRTVYTPQMIVQGQETLVGTKPMRLADLIRAHADGAAAPVTLRAERKDGRLVVTAIPMGPLPGNLRFHLVRFDPHERVEIGRGENAGRVLDYFNIVTQWAPIADWNGKGPFSASLELPGEDRTAVILQTGGVGPIVAAVRAD